ncbi:MAG: SUMF1/EgtB/PvdO family nonheme iron enzyme [Treponema sp.]|nr:SUMF1/EgtB/PvdO family nonheme iron enzyme [Treponema sp.]
MREKRETSQNQQGEKDDLVRLRPLFGLRPGIYLAFIYSILILVILFFILIYPGMKNLGALAVLKTEPEGAALRVNGVYMGTSPGKFFIPAGLSTIEFILPGFNTQRTEMEIPGRIFGSAIFPRKVHLNATLTSDDPVKVFSVAAADYAAWSFGGEPTAAWQIPLSLSEGAYRAGAEIGEQENFQQMLHASARFAVTRAAVRDMIRAKALVDNYGLAPSPASLFNTQADIIAFLSENPGSATWLSNLLQPEPAAITSASEWHKNKTDILASTAAPAAGRASPTINRYNLAGIPFTGIAGGTILLSEPVPHIVEIADFLFADTVVSTTLFERFLGENPRWSEQSETLIKEGLVSEGYLSGETPVVLFENEITTISWYAAQAFCQWLDSMLPPSMASWEVRLPKEAEWEYAVKSLVSRLPGLWEWCADYYVPLPFIKASSGAIAAVGSQERSVAALGSQERSVRGGAGLSLSITPETRASLPPETCSPFVSFRPVIAQKAE